MALWCFTYRKLANVAEDSQQEKSDEELEEEKDLLFAFRGAGSSFGIITKILYQVLAAFLAWWKDFLHFLKLKYMENVCLRFFNDVSKETAF